MDNMEHFEWPAMNLTPILRELEAFTLKVSSLLAIIATGPATMDYTYFGS